MGKMKNSGIAWIGDIPEHWNIVRVKDKYKMQTGFTPDTKNENFYANGDGFDWVNISDISKNGGIPNETKNQISKTYIDKYHPQIVPSGSLLYSFKLSLGQVAFTNRDIYTNEAIVSFINEKEICLPFLYYSSSLIEHNANTNIYGAKILNQQLIKNAPIVYPPIKEQEKIAIFLDEKCNEINNLVNDIGKQIITLSKYKDAILNEIITYGLNNAYIKNSNILWAPLIPSHWEEKPFRFLLNERNLKNKPIISKERLSLSIGLGVTLYSEKTTNLDRYKDDVSQYKIACQGDLVMNSMNMIVGAVGVSPYFGCVSPAYYTFFDNEEDNIITRYCNYIFLSSQMRTLLFKTGKGILAFDKGDGQINTCRLKVSKYDLGHIYMPVPPIDEMREIVSFLDKKYAEIDGAIAKKKEQLEVLEQYKKSLIYEYVTGKKEIK